MTRSLASAGRIMEVIDEKIDITDEEAEDIAVTKGDIEFNHVWFKYKDQLPKNMCCQMFRFILRQDRQSE